MHLCSEKKAEQLQRHSVVTNWEKNLARVFIFHDYYLLPSLLLLSDVFPIPDSFLFHALYNYIYCYRIVWSCMVSWNCSTLKPMALLLPEPYKFCNVSVLGAHLSCSQDCLAGEKGQGKGNDAFEISSSVSCPGFGKEQFLWICLGGG